MFSNESLFLNETPGGNISSVPVPGAYHRQSALYGVLYVTYLVGVVGNIVALYILAQNETLRNKKQTLMLKCLMWNDLIALLGMFVQMMVRLHLPPALMSAQWSCVFRVLWRIFGLGSGVVAIVMAVERWLALTHPFVYQKHVTYCVIKGTIFALWFVVLVLVCLPFLGFGLYFHNNKCIRYKFGRETKDRIYAYVYFAFGTLLSICIVCCNLAVVRVLCSLGRRLSGRRIRRSSSRCSNSTTSTSTYSTKRIHYNSSTQEELAFARLMVLLCITFVVCWTPQGISTLIAQMNPNINPGKPGLFFKLADMLLAIHFTLDPYIYVILRCQRRQCFQTMIVKLLCRSCSFKNPSRVGSAVGSVTLEPCRSSGENPTVATTADDCTSSNLLD